MRVTVDDLVRAFQSNGDAFEGLVNDLVRAACRTCEIDQIHVHWDQRTNVKDGGRDLIVEVGNQRPGKQFIPAHPSIWSLKSGDAGVSPASLKKEILDKNHPKVRDKLNRGWAYVWCTVHSANHDQRDEMREAANKVADDLKINPDQIEFRWPDHLQTEVNLYPNLIPVHLPHIASALTHVISLRQWGREADMTGTWVDFGGRETIVRRIAEHLLGHKAPNVLHIAGLSGIGKTRTVFEACRREPELAGVFYLSQYEQVTHQLYRYLEDDRLRVYLVIDETLFHQSDTVVARLAEFADRVRVVTIGPAVRQAPTARDDVVILPEPETQTDVLNVIRGAGAGVSDEVLTSISVQSGHDLRLALMLVRATLKDPEFRGMPVISTDAVWQRLMKLFADEIGNHHDFRKFYEILTASIDVGVAETVDEEIAALARHFQHPVEHLREAASTSQRCGLGIRTQRFFEATPRALAARLFAERVWPRIRDRLDDFYLGLPERLGRRFLERCHDCTGPVREEVMARLGDFFLKLLDGRDVTVLNSREASREFQAWAELDPRRGLGWLQRAVEHATPDQLRALDGQPDGSGGWRGRRQLVWLCQNLASFAEHFEACEAILFRLALHETEPSIGNNSTAIWQSLFWPALSGTDLPFDRRMPILLRRLRISPGEGMPLILEAAIGAIEHRFHGLPLPPRVVGGRVVPPHWMPSTLGELQDMRRFAGGQILDAIADLPEPQLPLALFRVVENLGIFTRLGLLDRVRAILRPYQLGELLRRRLVAELESQISVLRDQHLGRSSDWTVELLSAWLAELSSSDLAVRVRDLTAQEYWGTTRTSLEEQQSRYAILADELIAAPKTVRNLADWFASPEARSAEQLGFFLGRQDFAGRLAPVVQDWLRANSSLTVAVRYLGGTAGREGGLPTEWAAFLDSLAADQPVPAAVATTVADVSTRGLERLLALLDRLPSPASRFLRPLAYGDWLRVIEPEQRIRVAEAFVRLADAGDRTAPMVGLDLIQMWAHDNQSTIDGALASLALNLASRPPGPGGDRDHSVWQGVLQLLCPVYPRQVAELVLARLTEPGSEGGWNDRDEELLTRAAAADQSGVMDAVGDVLLDRNRRVLFGVAVFHELFEVIGLHYVSAWLERHGQHHLRWVTRHFCSPYLDEASRPVVPPLTEWLFREHEDDDTAFGSFLAGRSCGKLRRGDEIDLTRKRQEMQPFLNHELRRVRQWAEYEIKQEERFDGWFREMDEEDERR